MSGITSVMAGSNSALVINLTISANTTNYDLRAAIYAVGWNSADPVICNLTINSGVYVGSTSTSNPSLWVKALSKRSVVNIINNGYILGAGGNGGGGIGGPAMQIDFATNITNNNVIGGGGGGGGYGCGAGAFDGCATYSYMYGGGGGGGAGYLPGSGGPISGSRQNVVLDFRSATNGSAGGNTTAGAGGVGDYGFAFGRSPNLYMAGGGGGSGGGLGAAGSGGGDASWAGEAGFAAYPTRNPSAGSGGAAGACTTSGSNANITWVATGTRYGSLL